jgi:hypothetical protein
MKGFKPSVPELQAEFSVVEVETGLAIYLESRGGRGRNPDYNERLFQILERLSSVSATISDITVESTQTVTLAQDQKRLNMPGYSYPLRLRPGMDVRALRLSIGRAQEPVGQDTRATGGNRTKRIRIAVIPSSESINNLPEQWKHFLAGTSIVTALQTPPALTIVTDSDRIAAANQQFARSLTAGAKAFGRLPIGFQGGHREAEVFYQSELDVWMCFEREANRFWNAFGFGQPVRSAAAIVAEINSPYEGIDRRIAGAFAIDSEEQLYLVHRGKIGGGQPGISKPAFLRYYQETMGVLEPVSDGDTTSDVIVIGTLSDSRLPAHVASFVRTVSDFKHAVTRTEQTAPPVSTKTPLSKDFSPEFAGTKSYGTAERIVANCTHGLIVNTLERALVENGHRTANDRFRDLMIFDANGLLNAVFEVKPSWSPYSVYQAIGQLFLHTLDDPGIGRVAVLPAHTPLDIQERLTRLGIQFIGFEWEGQRLRFTGLDKIGEISRI